MVTADAVFIEILGFFWRKPLVMDKFTAIQFSPDFVKLVNFEFARSVCTSRSPNRTEAERQKERSVEGNGVEYGGVTTNSLSRGPKALEALVFSEVIRDRHPETEPIALGGRGAKTVRWHWKICNCA
jgi:hypothetical protein